MGLYGDTSSFDTLGVNFGSSLSRRPSRDEGGFTVSSSRAPVKDEGGFTSSSSRAPVKIDSIAAAQNVASSLKRSVISIQMLDNLFYQYRNLDFFSIY